MFSNLENDYSNIIKEFGIIGYSENDILKRGLDTKLNLPLNLLYSYPYQDSEDVELISQMMFPDDNHKIPSPKFFSLTLTNDKGNRSFLYCLKFPEKFVFPNNEKEESSKAHSDKKLIKEKNEINDSVMHYIEVPLVIYIKSFKEDLESFKQLLYSINQIIVNDNLERIEKDFIIINNYKKIQLINLLYFLFCLPHGSPHTLVKLQLNQDLDNILNITPENKLDETIDFYFSSNCEIPCNKNDTDINILFLVLDQSIIIKVLFSILTEKHIIFTASQAYLLHLIISTFLKLIFPFKWHHSLFTVLPKERLELLETPTPYIFGVLSSHLTTKDLIDEYSGTIIVDCDTNEIFGYSNLEPFEPQEMQVKKNINDKKNKKKKKDKDKEMLEINNLESNNFTQGNNLIVINKNVVMKYQSELNGPKTKLVFNYDNNIILDVQKSQLFIDKRDIFIDSTDWRFLRQNIQLVRNPELFDLDSIDLQNKKSKTSISNDEENPILPNRSFSYNIQNIILTFILKKLAFKESDFMTVFKKTNLYSEYDDQKKEYENTKGRNIIKNIQETKKQPRSIDNCFNIEFVLNPFNAEIIIEKIKNRINNIENDDNNNEKDISIYEDIKKILMDYSNIKEEISNLNDNNNNNNNVIEAKNTTSNYIRKLPERNKSVLEKTKPNLNLNKLSTKNLLFRHIKNNTSLLQETSGNNKYILLGFDKDLEGSFQFYSKNGFIYFANKLDEILKEEKIDIKEIIYKKILNSQIANLINKSMNEEIKERKKSKEKEGFYNNKKDSNKNLDKSKLRKILGVSIVPEKKEEENNEINDEDSSGGSVEIKKEAESDLAENLFNINQEKDQIFNWNGNDSFEEENQILNFSNFDLDEQLILAKEKKENIEINEKKEENEINHLMQFYLFLAFHLENARNDEISLNFFSDNLSYINTNKNEINNKEHEDLYEELENPEEKNEQKKKMNELIIKFYIIAYNYSDKKHRDFPYFSFYNFLKQINSEELKNYNALFDSIDIEDQLKCLYHTIIIEKQKEELKKKLDTLKKKEKLNKNNEYKTKQTFDERFSNADKVKNKINPQDEKNVRQTIQSMNSDNTIGIKSNQIIKDFISKEEEISILIINDIAEIINKQLETISNYAGKNYIEILEEMHPRFNSSQDLKNLISNLKYINLDSIDTKEKCFSFWLNCFNYLIIYAIFDQKLILNDEKKWKIFFGEQHYNIGGKIFNPNDMQYIIFKKAFFFSSAYKPKDYVKKLCIDKLNGELKLDEKEKLIPFLLYLPIKAFIRPSIYYEDNIGNDVNKRIKEYLNRFVTIDKKNYLCCCDLLFKFNSNIFGKDIKKFESFFKPELANIIKNKKYKKLIQQKTPWLLNFDNLIVNETSNFG